MTVALIGLVTFAVISLSGNESLVKPRPPSMFYPTDALPLDLRAPSQVATGPRLAVRAPVLAVHSGKPPKPPPPEPEPEPPAITFPADVHFDFNEVTPINPRRVPQIAEAITQRGPVVGLRIDGHADERGRPLYNLRLSWRRSCHVVRRLRRLLAPEVPPMQIRAFGEARPASPNIHPDGSDDPRGRAKNRRVQVIILSYEPTRRHTCPGAARASGRP